jgi:hypothetical protein
LIGGLRSHLLHGSRGRSLCCARHSMKIDPDKQYHDGRGSRKTAPDNRPMERRRAVTAVYAINHCNRQGIWRLPAYHLRRRSVNTLIEVLLIEILFIHLSNTFRLKPDITL